MAQCLPGLNTKSIFVMILGILTNFCNSQIFGNDVPNFSAEEEVVSLSDPPGHSDEQMNTGMNAFYALRGCHQILRGESGEIFSPDYLCSNPPLWCNWTIQVDPRMRIQLYLEDLIQPDACHLKQDQIHVDEAMGHYGGHKILQKCWREAKYVSVSNTLHVVLLIGGQPSFSYRGFHGRYQAFGPPAVYNPHDGLKEPDSGPWVGMSGTEMPLSVERGTELSPKSNVEDVDSVPVYDPALSSPEGYDLAYDYYEQASTLPVMQPWVPRPAAGTRVGPLILKAEDAQEDQPQAFQGHGDYDGGSDAEDPIAEPTGMPQTWRRAAENQSDEDEAHPPQGSRPVPRIPTAIRRNVEDLVSHEGGFTTAAPQNISFPGEHAMLGVSAESSGEVEDNGTRLGRAESTPASADPFGSINGDRVHPRTPPNGTERLQDPRTTGDDRNHTEFGHIPGDHFFEVTVELVFQHNPVELWDHVARSLLLSVKTLINKQLEFLAAPKKIFSKRIKRLSAGALYILWLQVAEGATGQHVHTTIGSTLQELLETPILLQDSRDAVIVSVSTAGNGVDTLSIYLVTLHIDVNECSTHLMLCDANAECVNHFGSYSCHCRPGFQDVSRLGLGTACVDRNDPGCRSGPSVEATQGVYVLFFLLSLLILTLLAVMAVMYTRHRCGTFPVPGGGFTGDASRSAKGDNGERFPANADSDMPPPPPPIRRPKGGWPHPKDCCPTVDVPLLRFNPILPLDGLIDPPQEHGKQ